jgi:hypothetical protein
VRPSQSRKPRVAALSWLLLSVLSSPFVIPIFDGAKPHPLLRHPACPGYPYDLFSSTLDFNDTVIEYLSRVIARMIPAGRGELTADVLQMGDFIGYGGCSCPEL